MGGYLYSMAMLVSVITSNYILDKACAVSSQKNNYIYGNTIFYRQTGIHENRHIITITSNRDDKPTCLNISQLIADPLQNLFTVIDSNEIFKIHSAITKEYFCSKCKKALSDAKKFQQALPSCFREKYIMLSATCSATCQNSFHWKYFPTCLAKDVLHFIPTYLYADSELIRYAKSLFEFLPQEKPWGGTTNFSKKTQYACSSKHFEKVRENMVGDIDHDLYWICKPWIENRGNLYVDDLLTLYNTKHTDCDKLKNTPGGTNQKLYFSFDRILNSNRKSDSGICFINNVFVKWFRALSRFYLRGKRYTSVGAHFMALCDKGSSKLHQSWHPLQTACSNKPFQYMNTIIELHFTLCDLMKLMWQKPVGYELADVLYEALSINKSCSAAFSIGINRMVQYYGVSLDAYDIKQLFVETPTSHSLLSYAMVCLRVSLTTETVEKFTGNNSQLQEIRNKLSAQLVYLENQLAAKDFQNMLENLSDKLIRVIGIFLAHIGLLLQPILLGIGIGRYSPHYHFKDTSSYGLGDSYHGSL